MTYNKLSLLKNFNLLLVEDNEELLINFKSILSLFFANVYTAINGVEALHIHRLHNIDMIITDYVMPFMNGYELSSTIRSENKKIPIVIMSNYSDKDKLLSAIKLHITDYLIKPVDYNTLIETLNKMIEDMENEKLHIIKLSDEMTYNFITKELTLFPDHSAVKLTKNEIALLEIFLRYENQVVSYDTIEFALSPTEAKSEQAIKNIIYRLRQKLGKNTIINIQDMGYLLKIHK